MDAYCCRAKKLPCCTRKPARARDCGALPPVETIGRMTEAQQPHPRTTTRGTAEDCQDVIIIGGGAAGLSAALTLARARRSTTVIDAGEPRNAAAEHVHGMLGFEDIAPHELLARGRREATAHGAEIIPGRVRNIRRRDDESFAVATDTAEEFRGRRLIIATGIRDQLPPIPGLRERWGRDVLHCPYCHGWEVRGRRIGIVASCEDSVTQALTFHQWSDDVTFLANGRAVDAEDRLRLRAVGIPIVDDALAEVMLDSGGIRSMRLENGSEIEFDALGVAPSSDAHLDMLEDLGVHWETRPLGRCIETDTAGRTAVRGVWAAGNCANLSAQVGWASAHGALVAQDINADQIKTDVEHAVENLR